jgi:two-component system, NarL family, response regulator
MNAIADAYFTAMVPTPVISKQIRILIADDHPIVRQGLISILEDEPDMTIVAQASDGQEAIALFRKYLPDIVLLDLRMPNVGGVEVITTVRADYPDACIIMLTIYDTDEDIYQGLRAGAKAYLLKDTPCNEIMEVIRAVCDGRRYIPAPISEKLAARMEKPDLSDRERQVVQLMASGKNNREIGAVLNITEHTVKFHVNNLLSKLAASDRSHAIVLALRQGIVQF